MSVSQYIIPNWQESEDRRLGFLKEAKQDAEVYIKGQRNYRDIDKSVDIFAGVGMDRLPKGMSNLHVNILKRDIREAIATLANMRPLWGYKSDNQDYSHLTTILNRMLMAWYLNTFADRSIRKALQYAAITGKGYVSPGWRNDFWTTNRGDIALQVYGPRDVLPYQIGRDHDLQRAYVVTIRDEYPMALAMSKFPTQIDKLVPDNKIPTWMRRGVRRLQKFLSPVLDRFGPGQGKEIDETGMPTVNVFRSYTLDLSYNDSGKEIAMGEPGTKWHYKVPAYKSRIKSGVRDKDGHDLFREATVQDAMLFPLRRLTMWTMNGILYDDTAPDWHAMVPIVPFEVDDTPWDFLGQSMVHDGETIQAANTRLARAIDDSANARLDPAMQYDENLVSQGLMDRFNPRAPGQRIKTNMQMGEGIKPVLPPGYYDVPMWIPTFMDGLWEKLHYILGTRDIQAIAKARQTSGDALEKMMELAGPIITDMSRGMEHSMRNIGEMWKGDAMQYYDLARRVQVLGVDGVTEEDFDYDPGNMIPSHLPDEFALIAKKEMLASAASRADIIDRARAHINSCYFHVTPNSLHQITQLTRKLMMLQLFRSEFPIDPWSVAEALDIDNYGTPNDMKKILGVDKIPTDKFGRWLAWMELKMKLLGQAEQPGQVGRPPTAQTAPTIETKDGGTRSTIRESPH